MASTLVFLGSTLANASQFYTLSSTPGAAVQTSLAGYAGGNPGPQDITAFGSSEVFSGGAAGAQQLWTINAAGTASQVTNGSLSADLDPGSIVTSGSTIFFSGTDAGGNRDLFVSDGTAGGTRAVAAGNTASTGLAPDEIVTANGRAFFSGIDAAGSTDLWVSDGTAAGTQALGVANTDTYNVAQMGTGLNPSNITVANGQIFFAGTDGHGAVGLWKSDGTAAGTTELGIANAAPEGVAPTSSNIVSFNGLTYFAGHDSSGNIGLWVTDGNGGDTHEIAVSNSSANGLAPVSLTVMNGALYFGGTDAQGSTGLWKSDGTTAGTTELQVQGTAPGGVNPISTSSLDYANDQMAVFNNKLYFMGSGADGTKDLWSSDGTGAGTAQVGTPDAAGTALGVMPTDFAILGAGAGAAGSTNTIAAATAPLTLGTGRETISFLASEDAYQGDAQFTISVDGKQIGGVLTETAQRSSSQAQLVTLNGEFGDGPHTLSVDFLNDAYGGSPAADRNLYVNDVTYDGAAVPGSLVLLRTGAQTVTMGTPAPGTTVLGSGSDNVTLQMSEDSFNGDAQFVVSVDGTQIGGTQTVLASYGGGQSQQFNVEGNFGAGAHTVAVTFTNDAVGFGPFQDRNLYVNSTSYDGAIVAGGSLTEMSGGTQSVVVNAPPVLTIGGGPDTIALKVSEDSYLGSARFTVAVDGTQIGGTLTAQNAHSAGVDQTLDILGSFGAGTHQVTVNLVNSAATGNLYVDGASYDGVTAAGAGLALLSSGPQTLNVGNAVSNSTTWIGTGPDMMALGLSEDFYQGDAQFTLAVDGKQVGGTLTASALHSSGQEQTLDLFGSFGAGQHTVTVNFLNDDYAGSPSTDRNLYLDKASYNGAAAGSGLALMAGGAQSIAVGTAQQATVSLGSGADTIALKVSEDYFQGDAQFTLAVDGKQIGGVQTASAQHAAGQDTTYDLLGSFGGGQHTVAVTFLNDAAGPNIATQDRNLYVDGASYDGKVAAGAALAVLSDETETLSIGSAPQGPTYLGSGTDTVSLQVSEDFYQGDAQFTLLVDGTQIGGVQTASAQHGAKQDQTFNLSGNFGAGQHTVSVDFLNDAYGGSPSADRNLYVDSASYDGAAAGASLALMPSGTQSLIVGNAPAPAATIGSGQDSIGLKVSEDFYQGDAQFTVSVDGKQVGGVQTATAQHGAGQDTTLNVLGNFGPASHVVTIDFLNDAFGPGAGQDRNVYVDATTFDGKAVAGGGGEIPSAVPGSFSIPGADTLTLHMSEDAYAGDAQYNVYVDGKQVGGTMTATANHGAGQTQAVSFAGSWGAGTHVVGVAFLNDAYGGSPSLNRNLYVDSIGFNGSNTPENFELGVNGGTGFAVATATAYSPGASGGAINTLGNDTVYAGTGAVVVSANGPAANVVGGSGQMTFFGGTGSNTVLGGSGASSLQDSGGSLSFTAGTGAVAISAGSAKEIYTIVNGQAGSTLDLYNFSPANDHVHLQGYSGSGIASEQATGGSTQIVLVDNTKIVLHGVTTLTNSQIFA